MTTNGTALAIVTTAEESVTVPPERFQALQAACANLRQAVKETVALLDPGAEERALLDALSSLDYAAGHLKRAGNNGRWS